MGSLVGHVAPGLVFFFYGIWHFLNNTKLHILHPNSYTSLSWFPTSRIRHLELLLIVAVTFAEIALEFIVGLEGHPFDKDGTIPFTHLHNLEHALINASFFAYSILALALDWSWSRVRARARHDLIFLLFAMALSQELLIFYHHSVDGHAGPEGQYHSFLVLVTLVALISTLMSIIMPKSYVVSFVRSLSMAYMGAWFIVIGVMLWTPQLVPKGCFLVFNDERNQVVRCSSDEALHRANSLVNLQFGVLLVIVVSVGVFIYLAFAMIYEEKVDYISLNRELSYGDDEEQQRRGGDSLEAQNLEMVKIFSN